MNFKMIKNNKEKILEEIENKLKRERDFCKVEYREKDLDDILLNYENVDIFYINSNRACNSIKFVGESAVVIWDIRYWNCFEKYIINVENCKGNNQNIIQGIISVMAGFLSEKYTNIHHISIFLSQIPEEFSIPIHALTECQHKVHMTILACKVFSLFHEIGHLEYKKGNSDRILACKELVLNLFSALDKEDFTPLGVWADLGWNSVCKIMDNAADDILEEIAADVFAIINCVDYFVKLYRNRTNFEIACACVISYEYVSTFQNMFNAVNKAWDCHYAEMKFGLPIRQHDPDTYINELAMLRQGLGCLILVIVTQQMLHLNKEEKDLLWELRDNNHIDNENVIACLADDEFICTAIEESIKR